MPQEFSLPSYQELVLKIYDAPLVDNGWQNLLSMLCDRTRSQAATFIFSPPNKYDFGQLISVGLNQPDDGTSEYAREYFPMDPFANLPPDQPITLFETIDEAELVAGTFYHLCLEPINVHYVLGMDFYSPEGYRGGLRLLRPKNQVDFGADEKAFCELILPHVKRALAINSLRGEIQSELELYSSAVNQLDIGTLVIDKDCRVLKHNAVATTLLDENDGIFLKGDKFSVKDREQLKEIQSQLLQISQQPGSHRGLVKGFLIARGNTRSPVGLLVRPISNATFYTGDKKPVAVFFIRDPDSGIQIAEDISREVFGFTKKEATVARMLADGMTIEEICSIMCLSKSTIRTHLRAIFSKTGVHHQSGLVKLMWSSITHMGATTGPETH